MGSKGSEALLFLGIFGTAMGSKGPEAILSLRTFGLRWEAKGKRPSYRLGLFGLRWEAKARRRLADKTILSHSNSIFQESEFLQFRKTTAGSRLEAGQLIFGQARLAASFCGKPLRTKK